MKNLEELLGEKLRTTLSVENGREIEVWASLNRENWFLLAGERKGAHLLGLRKGEQDPMLVLDPDKTSGIRRMEVILEVYFPELRDPPRKSAWERL